MNTSRLLTRCAPLSLAVALAAGSPVYAQTTGEAGAQVQEEAPIPDDPAPDEIVVTGTLIQGTAETAALPVDVISADEIAKQGSPSVVELLKRLPVSNGVLGDTNQFDARAQGSAGASTVNLRGLGPGRTLVLLNGRRLVQAPLGIPAVDISLLPVAALGRLEVLKDGAAATYGSDAIGGVVNFITNSRLNGLVLAADYNYIEGSNGDYSASATYGRDTGEGLRLLASFGYRHRSALPVIERDFTTAFSYAQNPQGGFTLGGNPSVFIPFRTAPTAGLQLDRGCEPLGGTAVLSAGSTRCAGNYTQFDNLVDVENRYVGYLEAGLELGGRTELTMSALIGYGDQTQTTSPSYVLLNAPSRLANPIGAQFFVPANNPGLAAYRAANPDQFPGGATNALLPVGAFRVALLGGNPLTLEDRVRGGQPGALGIEGQTESARFSGELRHELSDALNVDLGVTYHRYGLKRRQLDTVVDRLQLSLRGLGGETCNVAANTPGQNGCLFFNPFSNAIQSNPITGQVNPGFNPALANSPEVLRYVLQPSGTRLVNELLVADAVLSGEAGFSLGGGPVGFALGAQYRDEKSSARFNFFNNAAFTPCPSNGAFNATTCTNNVGALGFLGTSNDYETSGDVYALFGELQLPFSERVNLQLAARYENYGGQIGSTFDPQARLRVELTDFLSLRGGIGTTFRGPPITFIQPNDVVTSLQFIGGSFRRVDVGDNPALTPESATTYSAGIVLDGGGFSATLDYFRYDLDDQIVAEPVSGLLNTVFGANAVAGSLANCANPLASRFSFGSGACTTGTTRLSDVTSIFTQLVNGPKLRTSGLDLLAQYEFDLGGDRSFTVGGNATYVFEYKQGDLSIGDLVVSPGFEAVDKLNFQTTAFPLPKKKGQLFAELDFDRHNLRVTGNYIDDYTDQRFLEGELGYRIGRFTPLDIAYRVELGDDLIVSAAALNVLDEDPPFARLDLNYDPFTASPLGRQLKIGLSKRF